MIKQPIKNSFKKFLQISLLIWAISANLNLALADVAADKAITDKNNAEARAGYSTFDLKNLKTDNQDQSYFCSKDSEGKCTPDTVSSNPIASFILQIINFITLTAGSLSFLAVVAGGFLMLSSAGSENQINKGKEIITTALIGLVISLSAYFIVAFVQSLLFETAK